MTGERGDGLQKARQTRPPRDGVGPWAGISALGGVSPPFWYGSRVRKNPAILVRIRSFAGNLLRANKVKNMSDARYRNALGGIDRRAKYRFV